MDELLIGDEPGTHQIILEMADIIATEWAPTAKRKILEGRKKNLQNPKSSWYGPKNHDRGILSVGPLERVPRGRVGCDGGGCLG